MIDRKWSSISGFFFFFVWINFFLLLFFSLIYRWRKFFFGMEKTFFSFFLSSGVFLYDHYQDNRLFGILSKKNFFWWLVIIIIFRKYIQNILCVCVKARERIFFHINGNRCSNDNHFFSSSCFSLHFARCSHHLHFASVLWFDWTIFGNWMIIKAKDSYLIKLLLLLFWITTTTWKIPTTTTAKKNKAYVTIVYVV